MNPKIYIAVPCHNRKAIVRQCLPTIRAGMQEGDLMVAYDDGSKEYGPTFLEQWADVAVREPNPIGIERQRANHFRAFWASDFDYLYLTDSDALHSINWRVQAERLVNECSPAPVCLYNTAAHVRLVNNTILDDPASDVIWRRVAPGISYMLDRNHARQIVAALPQMPAHWNWDWTVPAILGHRFAVSRVSFVDHLGLGGMHHPPTEGLDGGDRALNPAPDLIELRAKAVKALTR
jgi:glycosyltransferase involved in cell wall biosynthesis